ncbi:MAG TPA: amidohydrolase [Candidatus Latescibacteria bacterium]|nr:amidohydrolase [Candidatus Latescibacterota bacterium]
MIDIHTHIGEIFFNPDLKPLTPRTLLSSMDRLGIEKAIVLPIENPEETHYYFTTWQVLKACRKHGDRLIPFCNVDPRRGDSDLSTNFYGLIKRYVEEGCRGFGECLAGLPVDDPRLIKIYQICGELGLPVLIHLDELRNFDRNSPVGLNAFEGVVSQLPDTTFIAHGPSWWWHISSVVNPEETYPEGKVEPGGRVECLLQKYPNLYADLSAESGYNALVRDPEFAPGFLERNRGKLLFGTDYLHRKQEVPIVQLIRDVGIAKEAFLAISRGNAIRILNLTDI